VSSPDPRQSATLAVMDTPTVTATLTAEQAATRLGVSVRTLDRYVAAGLIRARRATPRAHRRFVADEVDRLLDTEAPTP
jgi:excisionase family DNA binding protein